MTSPGHHRRYLTSPAPNKNTNPDQMWSVAAMVLSACACIRPTSNTMIVFYVLHSPTFESTLCGVLTFLCCSIMLAACIMMQIKIVFKRLVVLAVLFQKIFASARAFSNSFAARPSRAAAVATVSRKRLRAAAIACVSSKAARLSRKSQANFSGSSGRSRSTRINISLR